MPHPLVLSPQSRHLLDKGGRPFAVDLFRGDETHARALRLMYAAFEPKECAQGLPPRGNGHRDRWLDGLLGSPVNLFARREGEVVGHAVLLDMTPGKRAEYLVFVHQEHQDCGIGSALTRATRDAARALGYSQLWLTVGLLNTRAIHVYERAGFQRVGPPDGEWEMAVELRLGER